MLAYKLGELTIKGQCGKVWQSMVASLKERMDGTVWQGGCQSWYKTADCHVTNNWPSSTLSFWWQLRKLHLHEMTSTRTSSLGCRPEARLLILSRFAGLGEGLIDEQRFP